MKKIIPDSSNRYEVWTSCQCFQDSRKPIDPVMRLSCAFSSAQMALSFAERREDAGYVIEVIDTKDGSLVAKTGDLFALAVTSLCG